MNKFVFKKVAELTTEKTELAEVKVDLALAQDVQNSIKGNTAFYTKISKAQVAINKNVDAINALMADIIPNMGFGKAVGATATKYKAQMDKLSKELGVSLEGSDLEKGIRELFMIADDSQGVLNDIQSKLKTIGK